MLPVATVALALAIFAVDTLTPLGMAVAVLYVIVLLMAARFLPRRGVVAAALGCVGLTVLGYVLQHGDAAGVPFARLLVSLSAIGITAFLVLENQAAAVETRKQAALLASGSSRSSQRRHTSPFVTTAASGWLTSCARRRWMNVARPAAVGDDVDDRLPHHDDAAVRSATMRLVRLHGFSARAFASAEEFLRSAALDETACLITDMQMPGMSGTDLRDRLLAQGRRIPVIFITAFPPEGGRAKALGAGAAGFLTKPFAGESLIACVRKAVGERNG